MTDLNKLSRAGESMSTPTAFDAWYAEHGLRFDYDDALEVWRVAERQALERAAAVCAELETKYWTAFKHADGPARGDQYVSGQSEGAGESAAAIRALIEQDGEKQAAPLDGRPTAAWKVTYRIGDNPQNFVSLSTDEKGAKEVAKMRGGTITRLVEADTLTVSKEPHA